MGRCNGWIKIFNFKAGHFLLNSVGRCPNFDGVFVPLALNDVETLLNMDVLVGETAHYLFGEPRTNNGKISEFHV